MQFVQTELASGDRRMVCWLARDPRVRVGSVISLAKSEDRWWVLRQYGFTGQQEIDRHWPVGGLSRRR